MKYIIFWVNNCKFLGWILLTIFIYDVIIFLNHFKNELMQKMFLICAFLVFQMTAHAQIPPTVSTVAKNLGFTLQSSPSSMALKFFEFTAVQKITRSSGIKRWKVVGGKRVPAGPNEKADFESEEIVGGTPPSVTVTGGGIPLGKVKSMSANVAKNTINIVTMNGVWVFDPEGGFTTAAPKHKEGDTVSMYQLLSELMAKK